VRAKLFLYSNLEFTVCYFSEFASRPITDAMHQEQEIGNGKNTEGARSET
jgi:hypothetical protein